MTQDRKELLREKMITRIPDCDMELVEELLAEERDLQNKLKEIAINNLITDVNTARKEERNAVLSEVEREVEKCKSKQEYYWEQSRINLNENNVMLAYDMDSRSIAMKHYIETLEAQLKDME